MRLRDRPLCPMLPLAALLILSSACATGGSTKTVSAASPTVGTTLATGVIPCETFVARLTDSTDESPFLGVMQLYSSTYTNTDADGGTGQTIRYLAVQPESDSSTQALVFFNGTSQITPDWPIEMLIQGGESLCDDNALVFSDYPGIGGTDQPEEDDFTYDNISNNVFNLLVALNGRGFQMKSINPIGWSLGTEAAIKFGQLAMANDDFYAQGMTVNKLFLIATKPGGDLTSGTPVTPNSCTTAAPSPAATGTAADTADTTSYTATGSQAMCVTSVLDELLELDTEQWDVAVGLKKSLVEVMFPYVNQEPYGVGDPTDICVATVDTTDHEVTALCNQSVTPAQSIETTCDASSTSDCSTTYELYKANRSAHPYLDQILDAQFTGQRRLNFTYDYGNCPSAAAASWTSINCTFNPNQTSNSSYNAALIVNGSPCTSEITGDSTDTPTVKCPGFSNTYFKGVYVFNAEEDMFIRHDYGTALCDWFNQRSSGSCTLNTYSDAGHAVMYDYPAKIFAVIDAALSTAR